MAAAVAALVLVLVLQLRAVVTLAAAAEAVEAGGVALELLGALDRHGDEFHGLLVLAQVIALVLVRRSERN